ncbi:MAG: molybdopterin molybdotransferase MoeA [Desulfobulbaceae bacterium]|uniref:Molybdopterin molybdenumtransferase n=1 Tax=Candidatus Desulfatifera sulfidica TaxID=2841691 RepID=A0A8J6N4Z5_9BACT|nr:molybdopterin molybdotransferase MoeA [Candidatus Desulfatifera sulfidica]
MTEREIPDLNTARRLIAERIVSLGAETVSLEQAVGRVPQQSLRALCPLPGFDQSLRDGYVIGKGGQRTDAGWSYELAGEIAAGDVGPNSLAPGSACRIMTGGLIPARAQRVIQDEQCQVRGGRLVISDAVKSAAETYVSYKGRQLQRGRVVVPAGRPLEPGDLVLLAGCGYAEVEVCKRPRVGFFCTGSELDLPGAVLEPGRKITGNGYFLRDLATRVGSQVADHGLVKDRLELVQERLAEVLATDVDLVISTGGMGPGKYDLVEEAFARAGGHLVYRALNVRPGRATLFGVLGRTLFFGLPGPPPAVRMLLNELVAPALLALQGVQRRGPRNLRVRLSEALQVRSCGVCRLRGGIIELNRGECVVRPARQLESPSCYLVIPARRCSYRQGELITVHLPVSLCSGSVL